MTQETRVHVEVTSETSGALAGAELYVGIPGRLRDRLKEINQLANHRLDEYDKAVAAKKGGGQ